MPRMKALTTFRRSSTGEMVGPGEKIKEFDATDLEASEYEAGRMAERLDGKGRAATTAEAQRAAGRGTDLEAGVKLPDSALVTRAAPAGPGRAEAGTGTAVAASGDVGAAGGDPGAGGAGDGTVSASTSTGTGAAAASARASRKGSARKGG